MKEFDLDKNAADAVRNKGKISGPRLALIKKLQGKKAKKALKPWLDQRVANSPKEKKVSASQIEKNKNEIKSKTLVKSTPEWKPPPFDELKYNYEKKTKENKNKIMTGGMIDKVKAKMAQRTIQKNYALAKDIEKKTKDKPRVTNVDKQYQGHSAANIKQAMSSSNLLDRVKVKMSQRKLEKKYREAKALREGKIKDLVTKDQEGDITPSEKKKLEALKKPRSSTLEAIFKAASDESVKKMKKKDK